MNGTWEELVVLHSAFQPVLLVSYSFTMQDIFLLDNILLEMYDSCTSSACTQSSDFNLDSDTQFTQMKPVLPYCQTTDKHYIKYTKEIVNFHTLMA